MLILLGFTITYVAVCVILHSYITYILISYVAIQCTKSLCNVIACICMYVYRHQQHMFYVWKDEDVLLNLLSTQKVITGLVDLPYMSWTALVVASTTMLVWLTMVQLKGNFLSRDKSILFLFSLTFLSGNSFFWLIIYMLMILLKVSTFCSKLSI